MNELPSLYIERNNCGNCYRCVRECAVKAVDFVDRGAVIDTQKCIECGECLSRCNQKYIKVRDDVHLARKFIKTYSIKVASVSPAWITEFVGIEASRFVEALKLLGFTHVSESALGAEACARREAELVADRKGGISISSRCPAVVDYIKKYKTRLIGALLPVATPMITHAKMIRSWWGEEARVVHISSCIALKKEAESSDALVDIALTFAELKRWMSNEGIDFDHISGNETYCFEPYTATSALCYPCDDAGAKLLIHNGVNVPTVVRSSLSGVHSLLSVRPNIESESLYLDLMACENGCLGSNGSTMLKESYINRRLSMERAAMARSHVDQPYLLPMVDVDSLGGIVEPITSFAAESDTLKALSSLGIENESQQINCNGCGYIMCRRFAKALSRGVVTKQMCVHYVQTELRAKFTTLVDKLSAGVAVVNSQKKIEEANRMLAKMLGSDTELMYEANPGLVGVDVGQVLPFSKLIDSMMEGGDESIVRDVQIKERIVTVSIHTVQRNKLFLVICRNMLFSQVRNEEIVARTQKVIRENLATVQKIAYLLGENASRTEAILNSILDSQSPDNGC